MSALVYLTLCKYKNKLLELLHKPLKLILTLGFVLLLVMNFSVAEASPSGTRPLSEWCAVIFGFYILSFITEAVKGFQSGGAMFDMADVNFLFVSPLKGAAVLSAGMFSRLGTSLWMGLAFIYQFALLRSYYPITPAYMLVAVIGYGVVTFLSQLAGMLIYFFTCGEAEKIKKAKAVFYGLCGAFFAQLAVRLISSGVTLNSAVRLFTSGIMKLFPVAGWVYSAVDGIYKGEYIFLAAGSAVCAAFIALCFYAFTASRHGYYEDVLLSAERNTEAKNEGRAVREIKINKGVSGIKKGRGASVLFYKHMLENRRTKSALVSPTSVFYLVLIGVYGLIFDGEFTLLFSLSCMVSFLPVLSGRWLRELSMPHVFLIPEPPVKKLFYILIEMLPKIFTEGVLQCGLICYICLLGLGSFAVMTAARLSVSLVLTGTALLVSRLLREKEKNGVFLAASVAPGVIFLIPSVVVCVLALNFGMGLGVGFIMMSAVNVLVSAVLIFASRNILKY